MHEDLFEGDDGAGAPTARFVDFAEGAFAELLADVVVVDAALAFVVPVQRPWCRRWRT